MKDRVFLPEICGTRPARWQRGGQRNQRRKWAITCAEARMRETTLLLAPAGRSFDVSRWKVGRIAPGTKSCEQHDVPHICKGARVPSGRRRQNRRCLGCAFQRVLSRGSSASPWFTAFCRRDGSLAVIPVPAHLRAIRCASLPSTFQIRGYILYCEQKMQTSAKAQAFRSCAARASICGTSHKHEPHGCSRIEGMRAR